MNLTNKQLSTLMPGYALPVKKRAKSNVTELSVHNAVCKYLKAQYPTAMFMSDFGAGIKMGIGMATRQSNQKSNHSYPDIIIFEPRGLFKGLMIEVKKDHDTLYTGKGIMRKNDHFEDQAKCIAELNERGYFATFGCGFDECKQIIDDYMSGFLTHTKF